MSASGLPGRRVDANLAGMMATAETGSWKLEGPVLETGGTANLTTTARPCVLPSASPEQHLLSNQSRRTAVYVGGGALLVAWLAAANTTPRPGPLLPEPEHIAVAANNLGALQNEGAQLRERLANAPSPSGKSRNPFSFAPAPTAATALSHPIPAPHGDEEPPAAPPLPLTLMGIAEQPAPGKPERTAILGGAGDAIYMVTVGQTIAARYSVTAIDVDAIELKDLSTGGFRRLALR
jgi:hypothetical protein